jgi:predicted O-methyltransferase YrrM
MTDAKERKRVWDTTPKVALGSAHIEGSSLVESRLALLDRLPKGLRALELGVAEGGFSQEIWNRLAPSHLVLVDSWEGERYAVGHEKVSQKFASQIQRGLVKIHKAKSVDFLKSCEPGSFDFIYIDTDHSYGTTIKELRECARIIAPGGFICGHDYTAGNVVAPVVYGVIQAVSQFCVESNWKFKYLTVESAAWNSFCLAKISH